MSEWLNLITAISVSTLLVAALSAPLRSLFATICEGHEGSRFWTVFTAVMLFVTPLLTVIAFGLPASGDAAVLPAAAIVQRTLASALGGAFVALAGVGWQLWSVPPRSRPPPAVADRLGVS